MSNLQSISILNYKNHKKAQRSLAIFPPQKNRRVFVCLIKNYYLCMTEI